RSRADGVVKIEFNRTELFHRLAGKLVGSPEGNAAPFFNDDIFTIGQFHTARRAVSVLLRNTMNPPIRSSLKIAISCNETTCSGERFHTPILSACPMTCPTA